MMNQDKRKKRIANIAMSMVIVLIILSGVLAVGGQQGWFDKKDPAETGVVRTVIGTADLTRDGIASPLSADTASLGKPLKGVFLSLTRQVIFLIPLILILPLFWGIDGILFAAPIADFFAMLAAIIMAAAECRRSGRHRTLALPAR